MDHEYENDEFYLEKVREFEYYSIKCDHAYLDEAPFEFNSLSHLLYSRFIELLSAPTAMAFMKTSKYNYLNTVTRIGIDCFNSDNHFAPTEFDFLRMEDNKVILQRVQEDEEDMRKDCPDNKLAWLPYFIPKNLFRSSVYSTLPFYKIYKGFNYTHYDDDDEAEEFFEIFGKHVHPQLEFVEFEVDWGYNSRECIFSPQLMISCFTHLKICEKLKSFKLVIEGYRGSIEPFLSQLVQPFLAFSAQHAHLETCLLAFKPYRGPNTVTIYGIKDGKFALLSGEPIPDYDMEIQN